MTLWDPTDYWGRCAFTEPRQMHILRVIGGEVACRGASGHLQSTCWRLRNPHAGNHTWLRCVTVLLRAHRTATWRVTLSHDVDTLLCYVSIYALFNGLYSSFDLYRLVFSPLPIAFTALKSCDCASQTEHVKHVLPVLRRNTCGFVRGGARISRAREIYVRLLSRPTERCSFE